MTTALYIQAKEVSASFAKLAELLPADETTLLYDNIDDPYIINKIDGSYNEYQKMRNPLRTKKGEYSAGKNPKFVKSTFAQTLENRLENHSFEQRKFLVELGAVLDGDNSKTAQTQTLAKALENHITAYAPAKIKSKYQHILTAENISRAMNRQGGDKLATPLFWQAMEESLPIIIENPDLAESLEKLKDYATELVNVRNNIEDTLETIHAKRAAENNQENQAPKSSFTETEGLEILTKSEKPNLPAKTEKSKKPRKPKQVPTPVEEVDIEQIHKTMAEHPHFKRD